jgi:uncharacterized membrane protein (DUF4010 family)
MQADNLQLLERLGVALTLGLLIGLERGWERRELPEGERVAGFRTFGLISLLGGVTTLLAAERAAPLIGIVIVIVGAIAALGYWRESERSGDLSITTTIAELLAFGLGALAGEGNLMVAAAAAVVVTLVLGFKPELHGLLEHIERLELLATLRLLLISVVLLPILPDRGFGPWLAINPYRIWWMVVGIAGISYVGYFGIKFLGGERGVLATGLFGGLVSSTVASVSFARLAKDRIDSHELFAAGAAVASATMFPRMLVIAAAVAPDIAFALSGPMVIAMIAVAAFAAFYGWQVSRQKVREHSRPLAPRNPLDLAMALRFGLILSAIMVLARAASALSGDSGLYALAAISGLVDVDAITLSVATMWQRHEITHPAAMIAILIPAAVNTGFKAVLVAALCGGRMARLLGAALAAALIAGAGALVFFPIG